MCDFFESLVDCVSAHSFRVNNDGSVNYSNESSQSLHPYNGKLNEFATSLGSSIRNLLNSYMNEFGQQQSTDKSDSNAAYLYPLIQANDLDINLDQYVIKRIFKYAPHTSNMCLAVGYFNLTKDLEESIVNQSKAGYDILVSSPQANGFFNSNGFSYYIPLIYSRIEERFYELIKNTSNLDRIRIFEYERDKWSKCQIS